MSAPYPRSKGQTTVRLRSWLCEACGAHQGTEFSHRIARSRGGTWAPSNGVRACHQCHMWFEDHPEWAGDGEWHIRRDPRSPLEVPVFLVTPETPFGGWYLLDDEGAREPVWADDHGLPEVPAHLPPGHPGPRLWTAEDVEQVEVRAAARLAAFRERLPGRPLGTVSWVEP